jgi:DNA-binding XRE family transcriptional regulator
MNAHEFKCKRKKVGTQREVAQLLEVSAKTVYRLENGLAEIKPAAAVRMTSMESIANSYVEFLNLGKVLSFISSLEAIRLSLPHIML